MSVVTGFRGRIVGSPALYWTGCGLKIAILSKVACSFSSVTQHEISSIALASLLSLTLQLRIDSQTSNSSDLS